MNMEQNEKQQKAVSDAARIENAAHWKEGQIDWRDIPNSLGVTYWEEHRDEPIPNQGGKSFNQLQREKG